MVLWFKRSQKSQNLFTRERLILEIGVQRVKKDDDRRAGILSFKVGAIGKHVRWQRTSRRGSGSVRGEESNLLRSAIVQQREILLLQARDRYAIFVLHHYIHLHKARRGTNDLRRLRLRAWCFGAILVLWDGIRQRG